MSCSAGSVTPESIHHDRFLGYQQGAFVKVGSARSGTYPHPRQDDRDGSAPGTARQSPGVITQGVESLHLFGWQLLFAGGLGDNDYLMEGVMPEPTLTLRVEGKNGDRVRSADIGPNPCVQLQNHSPNSRPEP